MSNKVDSNQPKNRKYDDEVRQDEYDADYDSQVEAEEGADRSDRAYDRTKHYRGATGDAGSGQGAGAAGSLAVGSSFQEIFSNTNSQLMRELIQQGYSYEQASQIYKNQTGEPLSPEEWAYLKHGSNSFDGPYPTKYKGYGSSTTALAKGYGSPEWQAWEQNQKTMQEAKDSARESRKQAHEEKIKLNTILAKILMGDIVGALQAYVHLKDKSMQLYARKIVEKLYAVSEARSKVVRKMAMDQSPKNYGGKDPSQAARAQDQAQAYTKRVQFYTQLMNEYQSTERELMDAMQTSFRDTENFWQAYTSIRDEEARTSKEVVSWR